MKICQRKDCNNPVTGRNHTIDKKYEVECDPCIERATKRGIYMLSIHMKPLFGKGQLYKNWTKEHADTIEEGRRIFFNLPPKVYVMTFERQRRKSID